jgi:hypothetical protein
MLNWIVIFQLPQLEEMFHLLEIGAAMKNWQDGIIFLHAVNTKLIKMNTFCDWLPYKAVCVQVSV